MGWKAIGYCWRSTLYHRFPDIIPINQTCRHEIKRALYPQGNIFGLYLAHRSPHRVQLDIGHCRWGCRNEIMCHLPVPGHQFYRIRDTGGNHQKRCVGVLKNRDAVSPKKLVANRKGIISMMTYRGLPISGRPNIKGISPNRNKAKTAYSIP